MRLNQALGSHIPILALGTFLLFGTLHLQSKSPHAAQTAAKMADHMHADHAHGHAGHLQGDMAMPMFFENTIYTILWIKSWETTSLQSYLISVVGLILFGVLHEAVAAYRATYSTKLMPKHAELEQGLISRCVNMDPQSLTCLRPACCMSIPWHANPLGSPTCCMH